MISAEDARWIVAHLEPEALVRRAWRASTLETNAAVALDMQTGELVMSRWRPNGAPNIDHLIVLTWCSSSYRAEKERLADVYSEVSPSDEVVEETAVRSVPRHAVYWQAVEQQLR